MGHRGRIGVPLAVASFWYFLISCTHYSKVAAMA